MQHIDQFLLGLHSRVRAHALLYRFTLATRILLAVGFLPTGLVKVLGRRFTMMPLDTTVGAFFETLYQSGLYWHFLGASQMIAATLLLIPATATLGAVMFMPIMINIFVITVSYHFVGTPIITGLMVLANLYLLCWDYDRLRGVLGLPLGVSMQRVPQLQLGRTEWWVYAVGTIAGLGMFTAARGFLPMSSTRIFLPVAATSAIIAIGLGLSVWWSGRSRAGVLTTS